MDIDGYKLYIYAFKNLDLDHDTHATDKTMG